MKFFVGMSIAAGLMVFLYVSAAVFYLFKSFNQTIIGKVEVAPEVQKAVAIKAPAVQVSELPKPELEFPTNLFPMLNPTNELEMTNAIQTQEALLEWLNQLETNR